MKLKLHPDMIEATRLTREGRLTEATTLLQRLLRSGMEPAAARTDLPGDDGDPAPLGAAQIIEVTPEMLDVPARGRSLQAGWKEPDTGGSPPGNTSVIARPPMPDRLHGFIAKVRRIGATLSPTRTSSAVSPADDPAVLPAGGQFLTATFADQAGTRDYKLYIPSAYQGQQMPLIVMLHGCTQSADDFAAGTGMNMVAEERACFVAYPVQPNSANGSKCWNWFKPGDQQRGRGEPALIAGITRQISRDYAIDPQRIYVAGLSAGGAAAAIMGATYPDIYAAVGVHSGLACGAAIDLPSAFSAMRQGTSVVTNRSPRSFGFHGRDRLVPTIVFHGGKDLTVHPRNGNHVIEQSRSTRRRELRCVAQRGHVPGGHTYSRTSHFDESGRAMLEMWVVHGAGHAWSGGSPAGSYTDPRGPDASREMVRFFLDHKHPHPSETQI